jgi:hypothetical protein
MCHNVMRKAPQCVRVIHVKGKKFELEAHVSPVGPALRARVYGAVGARALGLRTSGISQRAAACNIETM